MDQNTLFIIAGAAGVIIILIILRRVLQPVDRFDDFDEDINIDDSDDKKARTAKKKAKKAEKKRKIKPEKVVGGDPNCSHHYEVTGFPADRLGTHVNIECTKCGSRMTVTVEDSKSLLKQRDDIREAIDKSKGR